MFYGRSELTSQLIQRLGERLVGGGVLLVVGASGAGKSSLLMAGLMPRLAAGALGPGSSGWPRRVIRPTVNPLGELASHLADEAGVEPVSVYQSLLATPGGAPLLVDRAVKAATSLGAGAGRSANNALIPPRLILVVDQFEELFTAGGDTDTDWSERDAFVAALHAAASAPAGSAQVPKALVVVAVRADFLGQAIVYPPLREAVDAGSFTVGPMSEAELRLAITGPAAEAALEVEPALVDAVISEVRCQGTKPAGKRGTPAGIAGNGYDLGTAQGYRTERARLPARGRRSGCGQPERPSSL